MPYRPILISAIAFISLLASHAAYAQPRFGRERLPNRGACFYEDVNYRGDYFCVRQGERLPSLPSGMGEAMERALG